MGSLECPIFKTITEVDLLSKSMNIGDSDDFPDNLKE